jgi:NAD(P)H-hydrate epimerase
MNSMLAHGGTGDVLAGLLAGFIAQGAEPFEAATAAVYVHTETASAVAKEYGEAAGLAQDLLRALPEVRKNLDSRSGSSLGSSGMGGMGGFGALGGLGGGMGGLGGGMPDLGSLGLG